MAGAGGFEPRLAESESAAPERPEGSRRPAPIVDRTNSPTVLQATMSSRAALVAASDLKVAGVMGIFEAAIGVPALKAVSRLIRELLRTRTGPGDRDLPALQLDGIPDPLCRRSTGYADCRHCSLCAEAGRYQR